MDYILAGIQEAFVLLLSGDEEVYTAVFATLKVSSMSIFFTLVIGLPAGFLLGYTNFPGKNFVRSVVDALLALPTVVVGLWVYASYPAGPLGNLTFFHPPRGCNW